MKPLRARVIKFSVDGCGRGFCARFDAPGAPVTLVSAGQKLSNFGDGIARRAVSEIHVCRSFRPTTASASRPRALSGSVNRYSREFESVQPGRLSGSACQQTRTCQGRKRRVWRVERGQRAEPWRLRARPGWRHFQPENRAGTQILANVWDNGQPPTAMASSKTGRREVTVFGCGSPLSTLLEVSPRIAFEEPATGPPTGSMWGRPPGTVAWTGSTKRTAKPSKTSTSARWSAMPGSIYAAILPGKQIP
jgi:hypothetical protein